LELISNSFSAIVSLPEIPYEIENSITTPQKLLFKKSRVRYRKDDLTEILAVGELEPLGLPGVAHDLTFTPGLLNNVFQRSTDTGASENLILDSASVLGNTGVKQVGYVNLDVFGISV
jgi:hypothetical protein